MQNNNCKKKSAVISIIKNTGILYYSRNQSVINILDITNYMFTEKYDIIWMASKWQMCGFK